VTAERSRLLDGVLLSIGTLTAVRVPPPRLVDRRAAAVAMAAAPLTGLVPGGLAWAVTAAAGSLLLPGAVVAVLAVGVLALATRGLHLDGLADTADGFASGHDGERALVVMRRGDTGPAGAATLVLVLLLQVIALAFATDRHGAVAVLVAAVCGRAALAVACARGVPSARAQGLGATVAGSVPVGWAVAVVVLTVLAATLVLGVAGATAAGVALLAAAAVTWRAVRRFGGVTGDVLGACVEAATAAALVVLCI